MGVRTHYHGKWKNDDDHLESSLAGFGLVLGKYLPDLW